MMLSPASCIWAKYFCFLYDTPLLIGCFWKECREFPLLLIQQQFKVPKHFDDSKSSAQLGERKMLCLREKTHHVASIM